MEDMLGKMGEILSDPESMKQIQELAQMLQQESASEEASSASSESADNTDAENNSASDHAGFDFDTLLRVQEMMGAMQKEDEDAKLLLALRPHLKTQRQKKVDQAVKLLKLYAVFIAVKENGLLQDFL